MDAEIGELPVDILDRGSDGSETEPAGQSEAAGPITTDNRDSSDHEVDVENTEGSSSVVGCNDTDKARSPNIHELLRKADAKACTSDDQRVTATVDGGSEPTGENVADLVTTEVHKRDSEVLTSDNHLLARVLNDLKGINAPKCDFPFNCEPSCSPETRKRCFRNPCEVSQAHPNQDGWLAERKHPTPDLPEKQQSNSVTDQDRGLVLPTCQTTTTPQPSLEEPKEYGIREEGGGIPTLLKQASTIQSYNRHSPPPLKHNDGRTLDISPIPPVNVHTTLIPDADPVDENSSVGLNSDTTVSPADLHVAPELARNNQAILPISALKRHFRSTLALRKELVSTSSILAIDVHSSCHLVPTDPHSAAPSEIRALTTSIHSGHEPLIDSHSSSLSENSSRSADGLPNLDICSSKLHSRHESINKISSRSPSINLHPVNLSAIDFHSAKSGWSTEKPAHTDSTSGDDENKTFGQNTCRVVPIDLHPCSSVYAEDTPTGSGVFSGVKSNNISPLVSISSTDSRTQNPKSPTDYQLASKKEIFLERLGVSSAPSSSLSPTDMHPSSGKSVVDHHFSGAASGLTNSKESLVVNHEDASPHGVPPAIDLHFTSRAPLPNPLNCINATDRHFNHTALSSSSTEHTITFHTSQRKCASQSKPMTETHSELLHLTYSDLKSHNHFDPSSTPQLPSDTYLKHNLPVESQRDSQPRVDFHPKNSLKDFKLHTSNHITSYPRSAENQFNSNSSIDTHSDSQPPTDEPQLSQQHLEHTHSATDKLKEI